MTGTIAFSSAQSEAVLNGMYVIWLYHAARPDRVRLVPDHGTDRPDYRLTGRSAPAKLRPAIRAIHYRCADFRRPYRL